MVASRSALASQVGADIMRDGGNAIDAAVATGFALAVTYPDAGNLGGGGFMVIRLSDGRVVTNDHRERAPAAAQRDMYLDAKRQCRAGPVDGIASRVGVPGSVAGMLDVLEKYGTLPRKKILAPAIRLAKDGFVLNDDLARDSSLRPRSSSANIPAARVYFSKRTARRIGKANASGNRNSPKRWN